MAYDEDLADRIRELLRPHHSVDEMRMFRWAGEQDHRRDDGDVFELVTA